MTNRKSRNGTVYLLHFDRRYKHAGHYIGWAQDLDTRLAEHAAGHGARLLEVVRKAGIGWTLARTWPGTRTRERRLKNRGGASRCCPLCGVTPQPDRPRRVGTARIATSATAMSEAIWPTRTPEEQARIDAHIDELLAAGLIY